MKVSLLSLTPLLLASAGAAQAPQVATHGLTAFPDKLLGSGSDYVIELTADQVRYTAALGRAVQETASLTVRRGPIRVGGTELLSDAPSVGMPVRAGDDALFDLGNGLTERWTVGPGGVELSYILAERPTEPGAFTVTLWTETGLTRTAGSRESGWTFTDELGNGIRVGAVTGIGAEGREAAGWIDLHDGRIELGLPESFLREASYPLVLDPLFGTEFGVNGTSDSFNPAIATMDSAQRRMTVWELPVSPFDVAIQAQITDLAGNPLGGLITIQGGNPNAAVDVGVLVPSNPFYDDRFVVAWEVQTNDLDIFGSTWDKDGTFWGDAVIAATPGVDEHSPSVGSGEIALSCAWVEDGAGIRSAGIAVDPAGLPNVLAPVTVSTDPHDHSPSVGERGLGASLIVWANTPPGGTDSIRGRVAPSGPITDFAVGGTFGHPAATSPEEDDFVVCWESFNGGNWDVWGLRARMTNTLGFDVSATRKILVSGEDEQHPALASTRGQVLLAAQRGTPNNPSVALRALDSLSLVDTEPEIVVPMDTLSPPDVSGYENFLSFAPEFTAVWIGKNSATGGSSVYGQGVAANAGLALLLPLAGCDAEQSVPRCGAAISDNPSFISELHGAEPGVLAFLGLGFVDQSIPWGSGILVPNISSGYLFAVGVTDASGYVSLEGALPPAITGVIFWEQWALVGGSFPWCAPGFYDITDALEIVVDL